ncbi:MAG: hypothetical protein NTX27_09445 [Verrucomicrobia bacterium]|jgi:hypothetical protein|nr:hypothetical protein [Verrucomicrobiota bacterium]
MSLKALHLVFVNAFSILAFCFAAWLLKHYSTPEGQALDLVGALGSTIAGIAIIVYGVRFLKKLKNISYL